MRVQNALHFARTVLCGVTALDFSTIYPFPLNLDVSIQR